MIQVLTELINVRRQGSVAWPSLAITAVPGLLGTVPSASLLGVTLSTASAISFQLSHSHLQNVFTRD